MTSFADVPESSGKWSENCAKQMIYFSGKIVTLQFALTKISHLFYIKNCPIYFFNLVNYSTLTTSTMINSFRLDCSTQQLFKVQFNVGKRIGVELILKSSIFTSISAMIILVLQ